MKVKVVYLGSIRQKAGVKEEKLNLADGLSVADLLSKIIALHATLKDIIRIGNESLVDPSFVVLLNGLSINLTDAKSAKLKDGDTVTLMTPISGGDAFKSKLGFKSHYFYFKINVE